MSSQVGAPTPSDGGGLSDSVIACAVVSLVVSAMAVVARFYTRIVIVRVLAAEDWFVLAAWVRTSVSDSPSSKGGC